MYQSNFLLFLSYQFLFIISQQFWEIFSKISNNILNDKIFKETVLIFWSALPSFYDYIQNDLDLGEGDEPCSETLNQGVPNIPPATSICAPCDHLKNLQMNKFRFYLT